MIKPHIKLSNTRTQINDVLLHLLGDKSLVKRWWCSPNQAFNGCTPNSKWKGSSADQHRVIMYVLQQVHPEGS